MAVSDSSVPNRRQCREDGLVVFRVVVVLCNGRNRTCHFSGENCEFHSQYIPPTFSRWWFSGIDSLYLEDWTSVGGTLTVSTGVNADSVYIDDVTIEKTVSIQTGDGSDMVVIEFSGLAAGPVSRFLAAVLVSMGNEDDACQVGKAGEAGNSAVFSAGATFNGGAGAADLLDILGNGNTFALTPLTPGFGTVMRCGSTRHDAAPGLPGLVPARPGAAIPPAAAWQA